MCLRVWYARCYVGLTGLVQGWLTNWSVFVALLAAGTVADSKLTGPIYQNQLICPRQKKPSAMPSSHRHFGTKVLKITVTKFVSITDVQPVAQAWQSTSACRRLCLFWRACDAGPHGRALRELLRAPHAQATQGVKPQREVWFLGTAASSLPRL